MKYYLILISGFIFGIWLSWPGIVSFKNWECFFEVIQKSKKEKLSLKAALYIYPKFMLRGDSLDKATKLRIVSDTCFR